MSSTTYNAAGQMTTMGPSESRAYNRIGQLTNITASGLNLTYTYPAPGQNAGRAATQTDNVSGETVTYVYDTLNRLKSATTASTWGQSFAYDPSGNLTDKTVTAGSAPTLHIVPDAQTNHVGAVDAFLSGRRIRGSRSGSPGKYFPYGEDRDANDPSNDNLYGHKRAASSQRRTGPVR